MTSVPQDKEVEEYTLDTKQCAEVALYMYKEWEKAMEPPLFIWKSFPEWLANLTQTKEEE